MQAILALIIKVQKIYSCINELQGDTAPWVLYSVGIKTKVQSQYRLILKRMYVQRHIRCRDCFGLMPNDIIVTLIAAHSLGNPLSWHKTWETIPPRPLIYIQGWAKEIALSYDIYRQYLRKWQIGRRRQAQASFLRQHLSESIQAEDNFLLHYVQGDPTEFYSENWSILHAVWDIYFYF